MAKAVVIHPGGRAVLKDVSGYRALSDEIGGFVEAVSVGPDAMAFLHEEGKLLGLDRNGFGEQVLRDAGCGLHPLDVVVGPVVIYGLPDDEGEVSDVPSRIAAIAGCLDHPSS